MLGACGSLSAHPEGSGGARPPNLFDDLMVWIPPGREAATFAAKGSGGALKLPQRVRAEPGRQTFMVILWCENEIWEAPFTAARVFPSIAPTVLGGPAERSSSPSGSGPSPAAKRF